ncbi:unnamed protein product [Caenorhabditis auriculariae]|uniref:Uncharacterized protein n=1 Tax=Caenorhabditis auriculariae TaxID=2777116 RepID=A0A8S1HN07_9PELO|nr:unnamed protein product [Caenorhabditis auriculariae]
MRRAVAEQQEAFVRDEFLARLAKDSRVRFSLVEHAKPDERVQRFVYAVEHERQLITVAVHAMLRTSH